MSFDPALSPAPAIYREHWTGDIVINRNGRTCIRLAELVLADDRYLYTVTIAHGDRTHEFVPRGDLMMAMFAAIDACVSRGYIMPPRSFFHRRFHMQRTWAGVRDGVLEYRIGCRCNSGCHRHRPLLLVSRGPDGATTVHCLDKGRACQSAFVAMQWAVGLLIGRRYLL